MIETTYLWSILMLLKKYGVYRSTILRKPSAHPISNLNFDFDTCFLLVEGAVRNKCNLRQQIDAPNSVIVVLN